MTSQIDSKYVFPEDVRPQPLNNFTTQETCLPFSVEALISDKSPRIRPGNVDTTRKGCYSTKIRSPASNELPQRVVRDAPVKSQSLERGDCTPWMTRSESPTPPPQSNSVFSEKTQDQPEAPHSLHHLPAAGPGEEVLPEAVPVHRRAGRVLLRADPIRDPGEDLVPEPQSQSQAAPGGRGGEAEDGRLCRRGESRVPELMLLLFLGSFPVPRSPAAGVIAAVWTQLFIRTHSHHARRRRRRRRRTSGHVQSAVGIQPVPPLLRPEGTHVGGSGAWTRTHMGGSGAWTRTHMGGSGAWTRTQP
ncbi:unnamed protein product [Boreogadus saida]